MSKFWNGLSRRKFIGVAGATALGSVVLKGCAQNVGDDQTTAGSADNQEQSQTAPDDEAALYEAAKQEGKLVLYTVFSTQEVVNEIGAAFTAKYPGLTFEGTRNTASTLFQKINQEIQAGLKVTDIFGTTDISQMMQLKEQGQLTQYEPPGKENVVEAHRNLDPDNFYQPGAFLPIIIAYNTQKISAEDAPKSWQELIQDKYKDQIATGSGAASGQVGTWALAMQQKYGWDDYVVKFSQLNPQLGRSINDVIPVLVSGERALGIATQGQVLTRKAQGDPLEIIYPTDGAVLVVGPYGILKNAPHPNAAKLFMNFLMSPDYSELIAEYYEQPLLENVSLGEEQTIKDMQVLAPTPEEIQQGIPEIIGKWRDLFGA